MIKAAPIKAEVTRVTKPTPVRVVTSVTAKTNAERQAAFKARKKAWPSVEKVGYPAGGFCDWVRGLYG
jgi:hypothetical protein